MEDAPPVSCCTSGSANACVFAKALLSRAASCELAARSTRGEQEVLECTSPVARINCGTLAALMHERSRFALRLPGPSRPLMHQQAMRLQCGGLAALREVLGVAERDVHRLVASAYERHASLTELPWEPLVAATAAWAPRKRAASEPRTRS
ncbi:MAG: hypothetical protein ABI633_03090 [Burkholderiales bacterium]